MVFPLKSILVVLTDGQSAEVEKSFDIVRVTYKLSGEVFSTSGTVSKEGAPAAGLRTTKGPRDRGQKADHSPRRRPDCAWSGSRGPPISGAPLLTPKLLRPRCPASSPSPAPPSLLRVRRLHTRSPPPPPPPPAPPRSPQDLPTRPRGVSAGPAREGPASVEVQTRGASPPMSPAAAASPAGREGERPGWEGDGGDTGRALHPVPLSAVCVSPPSVYGGHPQGQDSRGQRPLALRGLPGCVLPECGWRPGGGAGRGGQAATFPRKRKSRRGAHSDTRTPNSPLWGSAEPLKAPRAPPLTRGLGRVRCGRDDFTPTRDAPRLLRSGGRGKGDALGEGCLALSGAAR